MKTRRLRLVSVGTKLGAILLAVVPVFLYIGAFEPYLSPPPTVLGAADPLVFLMLAFVVIVMIQPSNHLRKRYWADTAREVGLTPEEDDLGKTVFSGTVRGRQVRARIGVNSVFGSGGAGGFFDSAGPEARYTLVEVQLATAPTEGVVIGPSDQQFRVTPYDVARFPDVTADELVALGSRDGLAAAVLTGDVQAALTGIDCNQVYVGNARAAADTLAEDERTPHGTTPGITGIVDASYDEDSLAGLLGGRQWVSHISKGSILDPDTLQAQIDALVTVAETFEAATDEDES